MPKAQTPQHRNMDPRGAHMSRGVTAAISRARLIDRSRVLAEGRRPQLLLRPAFWKTCLIRRRPDFRCIDSRSALAGVSDDQPSVSPEPVQRPLTAYGRHPRSDSHAIRTLALRWDLCAAACAEHVRTEVLVGSSCGLGRLFLQVRSGMIICCSLSRGALCLIECEFFLVSGTSFVRLIGSARRCRTIFSGHTDDLGCDHVHGWTCLCDQSSPTSTRRARRVWDAMYQLTCWSMHRYRNV
ncbi:hypothetical protein C8Q76DRAFT_93323 [Earliella scabrosa]|nr:hypothetical protein C8Q76DRAFT_93323 [Earliella scabrosa]